jgi:hypothetical protein
MLANSGARAYFSPQQNSKIPMQKTFVRFLSIGFVASAMIFTACKKESGKSNEEKIVGKWTPEAVYLNFYSNGTSLKDTSYAPDDAYMQFNSDKTIVSFGEGESISGTWSINDNKLTVDVEAADIYDIKKLTDHELDLYLKTSDDNGGYQEQTLHLTK